MNKALLERINNIPLTDFFKRYRVSWEEGRNFRCPFPAHGATGNTPSGRYYPNTNSYGCFGCRKGGGPISFVMNMEGFTGPDAYERATKLIMDWYKIEDLPSFSYRKYAEKLDNKKLAYNKEIKTQAISEILQTIDLEDEELILKTFLLYCNINLFEMSDFLKKVLSIRNTSLDSFIEGLDESTGNIIKENIELTKSLQPSVFAVERDFNQAAIMSGVLNSTDVARWKDQEGRYVFPVFLPGKLIVGFSGRSLTPHILKYLTRFDFGFEKLDLVYGLEEAIKHVKREGYLIVVEGILDVMRCRSVGKYNVIAPLSTYLSEHQAALLKGLTDKFLLAFDGDSGGISSTSLSMKNLDKYKLLYEVAKIPEDEDPDSLGKKNPEFLKELLSNKWK